MTFDTTTIILIVLIVAGLAIMLLGLRAQRKAPPRTERKLGEDGSPYVASQERPYMAPPPPPGPEPAPVPEPEPAPAPAAAAPKPAPAPKPRPAPKPAPGKGVTDEVATAATDVAGEVLGVDVQRGPAGPADDLARIKGVGPKFVARLNELGITRFEQLAGMNATEAAHLDERMGPFQGRLARDRVIEQADLLARGDIETFEETFGKLGG
jgi:predicted flap endonuclease-1-like 5' DNA nuclease